MGAFSLKKAFNNFGAWVARALATPDAETLSDNFALSAFKKKGYEVLGRQSFQALESSGVVIEPAEATYILSKDNKEYVGSVEGFYVTPMGGAAEAFYCPRIHQIKSIQPKG